VYNDRVGKSKPISLHPMSFDEALKAILSVGKAPAIPKRGASPKRKPSKKSQSGRS
jgi:hypothetical protein